MDTFEKKTEFAQILLLDCRFFQDPALFASVLAKMDPVRKDKVAAWNSETDRRLSLGAGFLAYLLLRNYGIASEDLTFDADGKPQIRGGQFFLSLSHAGDLAMAGLSSAPIAVDVDQYGPDWENIASHFFTAEEKAALAADPDPACCFWRLWSRKECLVKRDGLRDLRELPVLSDPPGGQFWEFPLTGYSCAALLKAGLKPEMRVLTEDELRSATG